MSKEASLSGIMNSLHTVLLVALSLSVAEAGLTPRSINQFRNMILCTVPSSQTAFDYLGYGCYCGYLGHGTPLDDLDRCCQVHDQCYGDALRLGACNPILDKPYTEIYQYRCHRTHKKISCLSRNDDCDRFICECDREAAECFARTPSNSKYKNYPKELC